MMFLVGSAKTKLKPGNMSICNLLIFSCLLTYFHISPVVSINCARCTAYEPGCEAGYSLPMPCETGAVGCYTARLVLMDGRNGVSRDCLFDTNPRLGCRQVSVRVRNSVRAAIYCLETCDWMNCNSNYPFER